MSIAQPTGDFSIKRDYGGYNYGSYGNYAYPINNNDNDFIKDFNKNYGTLANEYAKDLNVHVPKLEKNTAHIRCKHCGNGIIDGEFDGMFSKNNNLRAFCSHCLFTILEHVSEIMKTEIATSSAATMEIIKEHNFQGERKSFIIEDVKKAVMKIKKEKNKKCNCESEELFNNGCQCGAI